MKRALCASVMLVATTLIACGGAGDGDAAPTSPPASPTAAAPAATATPDVELTIETFDVPAGSHPHDVAPAPDGAVWYTAQATGELGVLEPATGETRHISLGAGSAPHGVIAGPDRAAWTTDSGQNAIVRDDPATDDVRVYALPADRAGANLNTAVFDGSGDLWFTGQSGTYGRLDVITGQMQVFDAPRGPGPYGITATPDGNLFYASLAGSYLGAIDRETGEVSLLEPPTAGQGARRAWSDSNGRIWVSEWNAGQLGVYDPATGAWREWLLPGDNPMAYAVFVDKQDVVWLSDFGANAIVRFDPRTETFESLPLPDIPGNVRQIHGRDGEVWGAESAADRLILIRTQ
jgi:virginiamycin B lyase